MMALVTGEVVEIVVKCRNCGNRQFKWNDDMRSENYGHCCTKCGTSIGDDPECYSHQYIPVK